MIPEDLETERERRATDRKRRRREAPVGVIYRPATLVYPCPKCERVCGSRIGLFSHLRAHRVREERERRGQMEWGIYLTNEYFLMFHSFIYQVFASPFKPDWCLCHKVLRSTRFTKTYTKQYFSTHGNAMWLERHKTLLEIFLASFIVPYTPFCYFDSFQDLYQNIYFFIWCYASCTVVVSFSQRKNNRLQSL